MVETSELELTAARRCKLFAERLVAVRRYRPTSKLGMVEQRGRTPASEMSKLKTRSHSSEPAEFSSGGRGISQQRRSAA